MHLEKRPDKRFISLKDLIYYYHEPRNELLVPLRDDDNDDGNYDPEAAANTNANANTNIHNHSNGVYEDVQETREYFSSPRGNIGYPYFIESKAKSGQSHGYQHEHYEHSQVNVHKQRTDNAREVTLKSRSAFVMPGHLTKENQHAMAMAVNGLTKVNCVFICVCVRGVFLWVFFVYAVVLGFTLASL